MKMLNLGRSVVIGMIHVHALPGTPRSQSSINEIIEVACKDAEVYKKCKVDCVLVENMHDLPYIQADQLGPEITACMTSVCAEVKRVLPTNTPCGVQVLAGGNKQALAVALAAGLQFIRAEGFVFSHVADEGLMNACAGDLLRYRNNINATGIQIYTDIKKKHCSHSITSDISIEEEAKAAQFFLSDGLIVTGTATGHPANPHHIADVKKASHLPVFVGSGITTENVSSYLNASGFIVGSYFKHDGQWQNHVCEQRVHKFMEKLLQISEKKSLD